MTNANANTSTAPTIRYSAFNVNLENQTSADECYSEEASITKTYGELYFEMVKICCPIMASEFFQVLLSLVDIAFVGHLSNNDLAAAALASVWFNLWNYTVFGLMTAVETLLSQSFGAREYSSFGNWAGISLVIVFFATIVVSGGMAMCEAAMRVVVPDPALAHQAGLFSLRLIPGLFPYYWFCVLSYYLQNANIFSPPVWIGFIANVINMLFNWALVFRAGWGIAGCPTATSLTRLIEFFMIIAYMFFRRSTLLQHIWPNLSCEHFSTESLAIFMQIAIPGAFALLAWGGFYEMTTLMASHLDETSLGVHAIALNVATVAYLCLSFAVGDAASILVGRSVGDKKPEEAKKSYRVILGFSYTLQGIAAVLLLCTRTYLGRLFSSDAEIVNMISALIPIVSIFLVCDATAATAGIFRGLGRQEWVLCIIILGCWVVALPVAWGLAFKTNLHVYGLWWGMTIGALFSTTICLCVLIFGVDWQGEIIKATRRVQSRDTPDRESSSPVLV